MQPVVYHVKPGRTAWEARRSNRSRATLTAPTQEEALQKLSDRLRNKSAQVMVHGSDGSVIRELTFPRDKSATSNPAKTGDSGYGDREGIELRADDADAA